MFTISSAMAQPDASAKVGRRSIPPAHAKQSPSARSRDRLDAFSTPMPPLQRDQTRVTRTVSRSTKRLVSSIVHLFSRRRQRVLLPPEIHLEIIEHLLPASKKELAMYATVSRIWEYGITALLYRNIAVVCEEGCNPFRELMAHVHGRPAIAHMVHNLTLRGRTGLGFDVCTSIATCHDILSVISLFPVLRKLAISTLAVKTDLFTVLCPVKKLHRVCLDRLVACGRASNPYQVLNLFNHVKTLEIFDIYPGTLSARGDPPYSLYHEITVDKLVFAFPPARSPNIVPLIPAIKGAQKIHFKNVRSAHLFALEWMLFESQDTVRHLEINLSYRLLGILDRNRLWTITCLPACNALQSFSIVVPVSDILGTNGEDDQLDVIDQIIEQLPRTLYTLSIVLDVSRVRYGRKVDEVVTGLRWPLIRRSISRLRNLRSLRVALIDPDYNLWSDGMIRSFQNGVALDTAIEVTYHTLA